MEEYNNIAKYDIEEKLSGENFRVNKIISSALLIGTFLFLVIVIFLYQNNTGDSPKAADVELIGTMVIVFLFIAAAQYSIVLIMPKIFLSKENVIKKLSAPALISQNKYSNDPVIKLIGIDRTLMIIRLAMLEGVTIFGFVILMVGVLNNTIYTNNNLWLLIMPWLVQLIFTFNNYFNKEKVVERIYSEILLPVKT